MIKYNHKNTIDVRHGTRLVMAVYHGHDLVWIRDGHDDDTIIESCFGNGYWINDKPWINDGAWKNDI